MGKIVLLTILGILNMVFGFINLSIDQAAIGGLCLFVSGFAFGILCLLLEDR